MRTSGDRTSPWGQRLWFEEHEFDSMMDEVRVKAGQNILTAGTGVNVEAMFEQLFKVVPDYVDLPDGILGKTVFHRDGRYEVFISRDLSDQADTDDSARRRLRSTLAHECAHIVEHGHLHLVDSVTLPLFGAAEPPPPRVLCRKESAGEWWEYQANRGMASLLLPKRPVNEFVRVLLSKNGWSSIQDALGARATERIVRDLMNEFDVSMQLATYRLRELGIFPKDADQTPLELGERVRA